MMEVLGACNAYDQNLCIKTDNKLDEVLVLGVFSHKGGKYANVHLTHGGVKTCSVISVPLEEFIELGRECRVITNNHTNKRWVVVDMSNYQPVMSSGHTNRLESIKLFLEDHELDLPYDHFEDEDLPTIEDFVNAFPSQNRYECKLFSLDLVM
jgi:hypothetical protein